MLLDHMMDKFIKQNDIKNEMQFGNTTDEIFLMVSYRKEHFCG